MADIINLNRARKARSRIEAKAEAQANRVIHGRTRAEREVAEIERARQDRRLDGAHMPGETGRDPVAED